MKIVSIKHEMIDYGVGLIDSFKKWNTTRGEGIKVAVLDSGIDYHHDDLKLAVKGGVNFTTDNKNDYMDRAGHGTFCSGIIGARANSIGIIGVAPMADLYAVKILNDKSQGTLPWLASGIEWCIRNKMDIMNMSIGFLKDSAQLHDAIARAYNAGIIMLAAVGNDKHESNAEFPARYDEVIGVTAIDRVKHIAKFSTMGNKVEIAAPGVNITSTFPGNQFAIGSGTSFAVPHITGACALIMAQHLKDTGKKMNNLEMRAYLQAHCEDLGIKGKDNIYGHGLFKFG